MAKNIYLHWFRSKKDGLNFGDEITPYIIERITNSKVYQVLIPSTPSRMFVRGFRSLRNGDISFKEFIGILPSMLAKNYILGAGSILGWCTSKNAIVWGSGIIRRNDEIQQSDFRAVRGKYSQNRIKELGMVPPKVIGDPALLVPLVYNPTKIKRYKIGIIPHFTHNEYFKLYGKIENVLVINLLDDIEKVIDDIKSCELTISTSLHGLIVSHAYNIPSLWFFIKNKSLGGDDIKFLDYFSSVDINEYKPYEIPGHSDFNVEEIVYLFESNNTISKTNIDILDIQKGLLKVAPFELKSEYQNMIN
ncbi:MAG: polysaccharide pyruvyl transferase family protein [Flavobacteriales bacterium]|nr:polysaccharide pyruvyl transferase family protein [Flavobacteriales bacterium]